MNGRARGLADGGDDDVEELTIGGERGDRGRPLKPSPSLLLSHLPPYRSDEEAKAIGASPSRGAVAGGGGSTEHGRRAQRYNYPRAELGAAIDIDIYPFLDPSTKKCAVLEESTLLHRACNHNIDPWPPSFLAAPEDVSKRSRRRILDCAKGLGHGAVPREGREDSSSRTAGDMSPGRGPESREGGGGGAMVALMKDEEQSPPPAYTPGQGGAIVALGRGGGREEAWEESGDESEAGYTGVRLRIDTSVQVASDDNLVCLAASPAEQAKAVARAVVAAMQENSSGQCGIPMVDEDGRPRPIRIQVQAGLRLVGSGNLVGSEAAVAQLLRLRSRHARRRRRRCPRHAEAGDGAPR